jgi:transposase InsO family protein
MGLPRSSYYYRPESLSGKLKEDTDLRDRIEQIILEHPYYGYRRVTKELHRRSVPVNHKRVLRLMRQEGLLCRRKKRSLTTTDSRHSCRIYPNLARGLVVDGPNRLWLADITYIRLVREFVYLSVIMDSFSRRAVGWALSGNLDTRLTLAALKAAVRSRRPPPGCIHHSDRGVQYACGEYVQTLLNHSLRPSMSARGNPYDNAKIESFIKTLKQEEVYISEYVTFAEAEDRIGRFIERVYNHKRLHSAIGYLPPAEFEAIYSKPEDNVLIPA